MKKFFIVCKYCPISSSNVNTDGTVMNKLKSNTDSVSTKDEFNNDNNDNSNSVVSNGNSIIDENRNIYFNDSENSSIVTNNVVNRSVNENRVNISNFLNNDCISIYVTWYQLYNFLLDGRDAEIINLNYKKGMRMFYLIIK